MRRLLLTATTLLPLSGCGDVPSPVLEEKQRDAVVAQFERFCMSPAYPTTYRSDNEDERLCHGALFTYELADGRKFVGDPESLNRQSGRLFVRWQSSTFPQDPEEFYPGSDRYLKGKVTQIASYESDPVLWEELDGRFQEQYMSTTMRR